jgi:hypothetical protein
MRFLTGTTNGCATDGKIGAGRRPCHHRSENSAPGPSACGGGVSSTPPPQAQVSRAIYFLLVGASLRTTPPVPKGTPLILPVT